MPPPLPYGRQSIDEDDIAAVTAVLRSDFLTTGPTVPAFEAAFAAAVDAPHAIACSSGTAALHLLALALGIDGEAAVIVPSVTFLATANAFRLGGAEIVFADVDPDDGLMTPATARDAVARATRPVRALVPVHLGGLVGDLPGLAEVAAEAGAVLIEDACHALGTRYRGDATRHAVGACAHSLAAVFSLHPVKTVTAGEGGMIATGEPGLPASVSALRSHGMVRDPGRFTERSLAFTPDGAANRWYYECPEAGLNYRLTDIQAALGLSQLGKLPRFAAARRKLVAHYERRLAPLRSAVRPVAALPHCDAVRHLQQVLIDFERIGIHRDTVMAELAAGGIGSQVHYVPVHRQPLYRRFAPDLDLPGAEAFYARTLSLPLFPAMTEADVDRVVDALETLVAAAVPAATTAR